MAAKTILVVVDFEGEHPAVIERAAWLAERAGAALELFACDYEPGIDPAFAASVGVSAAGIREQRLEARRTRLENLAEPLRERGLSVTTQVEWGAPFEELVVRKVGASSPWIVAKETAHANIVQRTLLSNTDWHLIRNCPAPLWLVKARPIAAQPLTIAAVDPVHEHDKPAALDDAIVGFAGAFAKNAGGNLEVVHAFALPLDVPLPPDARAIAVQEHREALAALAAKHGIAKDAARLVEGKADESLRRAALERNADFIVMGAIARRGLKRIFIGSTAERVLDKLPCDLIIIKPPSFEPPRTAST